MRSVTAPNTVLNIKANAHDVTAGNKHGGQEIRHHFAQQPSQEVKAPQRHDAQPLTQVKSRRHLHALTAATFRPWERISAGQTHILNQQSLALGIPGVDIKQPCIKASSTGKTSGKIPQKKRPSLKLRKGKEAHRFRQTENIIEMVETLFNKWFLRD